MAKYYYYSITVLISLFLIASCTLGPSLTGNDAVYQLNVTVEPTEAGSVTPESAELVEGDEVEITASPNEGWVFDRWQGDHTGTANPDTITMDKDKDILALFVKKEHPLTVTIEGEGKVSEQLVQNKTTDYPHRTTIELTAEPEEGWTFVHWQEDIEGSDNPVQIVLDSEKKVTAVFVAMEFNLVIHIEGEGTVSERVIQDSSSPYQAMELTANPSDGWRFVEWKGDISSSDNPTRTTMDREKQVTAVFEELQEEEFSGGDGSEMNPFQVSNIDELQRVADYPDANFVQINNINASATVSWNGRNGFKPIGTFNSPFRGTYDGGGFEISGLTINRSKEEYIGLFGNADGATFKNTRLVNVTIAGYQYVGGLVGIIYSGGTIENSHVRGSISGSTYVGGLAGNMSGTILTDSDTRGNVSGDSDIGGLVGLNGLDSRIINSHSESNLSGKERAGGLVGTNSGGGHIQNSYATGNVRGTDDQIGGLVGFVDSAGHISDSHATGNVRGDERVGGLIGDNSGGSITRCYATGNVSGDDMIGGLAGVSIAGQIKNSYALGRVTGEDDVGGLVGVNKSRAVITTSYAKGRVSGDDNIGGLVGLNEADIVSSYWDSETTGQSKGAGDGSTDGITGLSTSEMTGTFAETNMPEFDWSSIWMTTSDYPILKWQDGNLAFN